LNSASIIAAIPGHLYFETAEERFENNKKLIRKYHLLILFQNKYIY